MSRRRSAATTPSATSWCRTIDGPATFQALRATPGLERVPGDFLTAKAQKSDVQRYRELGAAGVIATPFDPMTVANEVRRIVGGGTGAVEVRSAPRE